mmetsp:Transcript_4449/g.5115  ORF Transcript_4449/g.5115 Transcript_4449/m.5115 type:complete len:750 (-) Transcript_4449:622-2871(-)|eukprot:CAMPEP_0204652456 /NCGR_PEP_ID=MMETSP0718-20130828/14555_1 /ASSEMBLY_ACC=CAM_ASM_000674 /TAXON_ID=230516 /ORGANISM="Chaetoceros curvisetus" /LENGTH=749 /DNA_ID=CAMNT_0051676413 /DNA_START=245 /DNA_END=2494 /DNA_ORIENTATION=+
MIRFLLLLLVPGGFLPRSDHFAVADATTHTTPKTFIIDWLIPSQFEEDMYEGIKVKVGDTALFQWSGYHNIYIHPTGDCSEDNAILVGESSYGNKVAYTFTDDDVGSMSFACDIGYHCESGQFITINVEPNDDINSVPTYSISPSPDPTTTTISAPPGSNIQCDGNVRTRRDWDLISVTEKELFKDAIETAIDLGLYQAFLKYHSDSLSSIQSHQTCAFIHWHRRYLLALEDMLRSLDEKYACLTVPYWNIMEHYKDQQSYLCESFGSCSRVVTDLGGSPIGFDSTRVFSGNEATGALFAGAPIARLFDDNGDQGIIRDDIMYVRIPDECAYNAVFNIFKYSESFATFALDIQKGIHDSVHDNIGGFMPTYSSPTDPLFLVWHSLIDLLLYLYEVCNLDAEEETFDPFGRSCIYETEQNIFPNVTVNTELWMKWNNASIVEDPMIGKYFEDIGLKLKEVSLVNQLGEHEFTYEHLTPELLQLLNDKEVCPKGRWFTASPTATPDTSSPTSELDQDLFNKWIEDVRSQLMQKHSDDVRIVNSLMQFLVCTLGSTKQIPSDKFQSSFLNGTLRDSRCNFLLPSDDLVKYPSPTPPFDNNSKEPSGPKKIKIDWFDPTSENVNAYDGISATVGDTVQFQWSGYHNVYIHPSGDCLQDNAILVGSQSDTSARYTFTEDDVGKVSFACNIGNHCENGQFVTIRVSVGIDSSDPPDDTSNTPTRRPTLSSASSASKFRFSRLEVYSVALVLITFW